MSVNCWVAEMQRPAGVRHTHIRRMLISMCGMQQKWLWVNVGIGRLHNVSLRYAHPQHIHIYMHERPTGLTFMRRWELRINICFCVAFLLLCLCRCIYRLMCLFLHMHMCICGVNRIIKTCLLKMLLRELCVQMKEWCRVEGIKCIGQSVSSNVLVVWNGIKNIYIWVYKYIRAVFQKMA